MSADAELAELEELCKSAKRMAELDKPYVFLEELKLPAGCTPAKVDALLCLTARDGYTTRLYLAERVMCRVRPNWADGTVPILQRAWHVYSWNNVPVGRPMEVLALHLKALA